MTPLFGKRKEARLAEAEQFRQVRRLASEDVQVLGTELAETPVDTDGHHARATSAHAAAQAALSAAETTEDIDTAESHLVESRWELAAARAANAGGEPPMREAECFFNPQHGPFTERLDWTPGIGETREIDVCAACATHLAAGQERDHRKVRVGDRYVEWWRLADVTEGDAPARLSTVSAIPDKLKSHVSAGRSTSHTDAALLEVTTGKPVTNGAAWGRPG